MRSTIILLLVLAYAEGHAIQGWRGRVDTLPNGAVRVSNPSQGLWGPGTGWRLLPELQIGDADGPEAVIFAAIAGLAVDYQGRIYVLDRQANELRIFTATGQHVRTVGRTGGGPGEYRNANGLGWLAPDTLAVIDQRGERYTVLTRDGDYISSVPRQLSFYAWVFFGGAVGGRIYELATGAAISIHFENKAQDAEFVMHTLSVLRGEGADLNRVIVGHLSLQNLADTSFHLSLVRRGAYVEYDFTAYEVSTEPEIEAAAVTSSRFLRWLIDHGAKDRILISPDIGTAERYRHPWYGYSFLLRQFGPELVNGPMARISASELRDIVTRNPQRVLAFSRPSNPSACQNPYSR